MVILAQDEKAIVNMDNVTSINIESHRDTYRLVAHHNGDSSLLGSYSGMAMTKQVLANIFSSCSRSCNCFIMPEFS